MCGFAALTAMLAMFSAAIAAPLPPLATPEGQVAAMRRIQCSEKDGQAQAFYWNGDVYSRVPGEPDRRLFRVEGMNVRRCGPLAGATNGVDFRLVSREILLYEDPVSGEVLRNWQNPWTGATVEVIHVANDPVNGNYATIGRDGKPLALRFQVLGDRWWLTMAVPLFYPNPLGGNFQKYVGGTYHVAELFNFFGDSASLLERRRDTAQVTVGWQRLSPWLPWMEMGDRPGMLYFHTAGRKLTRFDELSATMLTEIDSRYPEYREPPPLDDQRPNETSWTYFRKIQERKQAH
jgi:hypothetical protein